ncbi:DUF262 domain-containing protein [Flavobacterium cyclinae]|uniref:DUF262 domain-containing protein n=1 Tax=Flavobacterium cyclinae TaxID=2895947 RepID=UPI001E485E20|nr:DUF262 domain-containing protein [Flavobacterium cyclinae]UGS19868.1 DUF262 domain-containing HNH endonuclease family protein [Flavobacterium cyclinae]
MNFTTKPIAIETIVADNLEFLIPVYQRPYVWDDIEIKKLLEDLKYNFENNTPEYFVGNTYVIKSSKDARPKLYEVIDGQQRFTTFWLISYCFKVLGVNTNLSNYLNKNNDIRFDFDIRVEVYDYLKGLLDGTAANRFHDVSNFEFLKNIAAGIETIKGYLNQLNSEKEPFDLEKFGDFIYSNVVFIFNEAPINTDLNALFVALGTSGIQLQQSDILKARLLDKLEKNSRVQYAKIWEACENMSNYFESNVKDSFSFDTAVISKSDFKTFNPAIFSTTNISADIESNKKSISQIIKEEISISFNEEKSNRNSQCRSIVNFNMFLLHVLRIYKKQNNQKDIDSLDSKKLLETFKIQDIKDIPAFFELLWKVRYQFDKHVVKWLKDEDESYDEEEKLLLSEINTGTKEGKSYFSRSERALSNLQMLQSILYFNNIPNQVWLTPFLDYLLSNDIDNSDDERLLMELERIDNILIPGDKKQTTWDIITDNAIFPEFKTIHSILNQDSGTKFNHYWFYKLEYLLWKNWDKNTDKNEFKRYRITSKNSIEHVFPQNDEYKNRLANENDNRDWLNSFGNLALLSVGQNSEYSNQDVAKKKIDFQRKNTYDSLKLAKVYEFENWNTKEIIEHQNTMFTMFENHYCK